MELVFLWVAWVATQEALDDSSSHVRLPAHGSLYKKTLYGFFGKNNGDSGLDAIPVDRPSNVRSKVYKPHEFMGTPGRYFRHHIQYESIWISFSITYRLKLAELELYNSKNWEAFFEKYRGSTPHAIHSLTLYDKYLKIAEEQLGLNWSLRGYPTDVLGYGSVPASETSIKSYILPKKTKQFEIWDSHFRWDEKIKGWKTKPAARFEKLGQWIADLDSRDFTKRLKAFDELDQLGELAEPALKRVIESRATAEARSRAQMLLDKISNDESKAEKLLEDADNFEKFPSLFAEDFYFFLRKNDYYFVTQSGKLYIAPPRKEGEKSRTMKELWVDAKRPITAVLEDADRDKVWLFANDKNPGAKLDLYFEMNETIRPSTFDPTKLRPVNIEGRAKKLLEYLPLITAGDKK